MQKMTADIWISIIAGFGFLLTAIYITVARRHRPTWAMGAILLLFCAELTFAHALQNLSSDFASKVFWYKMTHLGFTVTPTAFFCLALRFSGFGHLLTNRNRLFLIFFPALTAGLIFTNEMHDLMWKSAATSQIVYSGGYLSVNNAGIWYWFFLAYSYLMMGLGFFTISRLVVRSRKIYEWQAGAIVIAGILALLGTTIDILGLSPIPSFSATALGFAVGTITAALSLARIRRRDLISVSRTAIIDSIDDGILVVDVDKLIVDMNPAAEKLLGKQAIGMSIDQSLPELALFWDYRSDNIGEVTLVYEDSPRIFDLRVSAIKDWRGHIVCKVFVFHDITEHKRAEEDLRRATEGAQAIFWRATVAKVNDEITGAERYAWKTVYSNLDKVNDFLPFQIHLSGNLDNTFYLCVLEEDRLAMNQRSLDALSNGMDSYTQEYRLRDVNGAIHWMYEKARICKLSETQYEVLGFITDITDRKEAEEKILASIEEKEILLKEIHHRVKNNMQIISSLMNLQASKMKDELTVEAFRESQNRIRSMALIHEKLYRSENLARIRFDEYLRDLTNYLVSAYKRPSLSIHFDIQADPVNLDIDTAIPCGLIINELVTNSLKHGFPDSSRTASNIEGIIHIQLALLPENQIKLLIADNGVGFPEGVDFRNTDSLGLQLVTSLTYQLDGEVSFINQNGAQVELNFISKSATIK